MSVVTMRQLLESGVHFGHQTKRWNPKMKKYIFTSRNDIHVIDLQKTIKQLNSNFQLVKKQVAEGGKVLFVGTKKQAQESIKEQAERCGMYYVNNRWLGGMLTNFSTIRKSIMKLKRIEQMFEDGSMNKRPSKEISMFTKEMNKLKANLGGIKDMEDLPDLIFIVDTKREQIAVNEANRLEIPILGVIDTNCDPDEITYPIPANDDAIRAIKLLTSIVAEAVLEGKKELIANTGEEQLAAEMEAQQEEDKQEQEEPEVKEEAEAQEESKEEDKEAKESS